MSAGGIIVWLCNNSGKQWHHVSIHYFVFIRNKSNIYELIHHGEVYVTFLFVFSLTGHSNFHINISHSYFRLCIQSQLFFFFLKFFYLALAGAAQWIERWPVNQRVAGLIYS